MLVNSRRFSWILVDSLGFSTIPMESASFGGDGKRRGIAPAARAAPPVPLSPCRWHLAYAFVCTRRHALVLCRLCVSHALSWFHALARAGCLHRLQSRVCSHMHSLRFATTAFPHSCTRRNVYPRVGEAPDRTRFPFLLGQVPHIAW